MAPAQVYPNSWAFERAFAILYNHFGHTPSVDVFLYFFEAKNPGKRLWMSFNGVAGRVLLILFQQSYKGFKKKFFKICCNKHDPTLLDGFPLYWVEKSGLKKPRSLENLSLSDREGCDFLTSLGAVFNTSDLIKHEYHPKFLKAHIGICLCLYLSLLVCSVNLDSHVLSLFCADMALDAEKRRKLAKLVSRRQAALADVGTSILRVPYCLRRRGYLHRPHLQEEKSG